MPVFARAAVVCGGVSISGPPRPPRVSRPIVGAGVGGVGGAAVPRPRGAGRVNNVGRGAAYLVPLALQPV